ncbi:unnamed protein product, partial [Didymodactylos carnosus]
LNGEDQFPKHCTPLKCYDGGRKTDMNLYYQQICDGINDLDNGQDELMCHEQWPCDTLHKKCNHHWQCKNGLDELYCPSSYYEQRFLKYECNRTKHYCHRPYTGDLECMPIDKAGDNVIDCLGSTDERDYCRLKYPTERDRRYRCWNSSDCI